MDEFIEENKNITDIADLTFEYNEMEINALKQMAHMRSDFKVRSNFRESNISKKFDGNYHQRSSTAHYMGVAGEYAVAQAVNGFFDPMPKMYGDKNDPDVIVGFSGEIKIAVKTTKYSPPIFKISDLDLVKKATHMALCCFQEPKINIAWIMEKEDFMKRVYRRNFGYGNHYCVN